MINQTAVMEDLAYLLGENSVPTSGTTPRVRFIQRTLQEAYDEFDWRFARSTQTLPFSSGLCSLPSNASVEGPIHIYSPQTSTPGDSLPLEEVDYEEQHHWVQGDLKYWRYEDPATAQQYIQTTETSTTPLVVRFATKAPEINASVSTPFPNSMVIALGALRFMRISQNPQADISVEEQNFERNLQRVWARYQRSKAKRRDTDRGQRQGHYLGKID